MLPSNSVICCDPHNCDHLLQLVICKLCNDTVSNSDTSNSWMIVNNGRKGLWSNLKDLPQHLSEGTTENLEKYQSGQLVSQQLKKVTSIMSDNWMCF